MLIFLESIFMCWVMLVVCIVGLQDGPERYVTFYSKAVQERAVALGYTTRQEFRRKSILSVVGLFVPELVFVPMMVCCFNGAEGFREIFQQLTLIYLISGVFDRIFIDWYWVGHTKAWFIPGTEDLMPYISKKEMAGKWLVMLVFSPAAAACIAGIITLIK